VQLGQQGFRTDRDTVEQQAWSPAVDSRESQLEDRWAPFGPLGALDLDDLPQVQLAILVVDAMVDAPGRARFEADRSLGQ